MSSLNNSRSVIEWYNRGRLRRDATSLIITGPAMLLDKLDNTIGKQVFNVNGKDVQFTSSWPLPFLQLPQGEIQLYSRQADHSFGASPTATLSGAELKEFIANRANPKDLQNPTATAGTSPNEESRLYHFVVNRAPEIKLVGEELWLLRQQLYDYYEDKTKAVDITSLNVSDEQLLQPAYAPAVSPIKLPPFIPDNGADEAQKDLSLVAFTGIGGGSQGEGVTVVIFDTLPSDAFRQQTKRVVDHVITIGSDTFNVADQAPTAEPLNEYARRPEVQGEERQGETVEQKIKRWLRMPGDTGFTEITTDDHLRKIFPYHGLMVASQVREVAKQAHIILVELFNDEGETDGSQLAGAIDLVMALATGHIQKAGFPALNTGKLVLNLSLGFISSVSVEVDAGYLAASCERACQAGAVIVASAGNDSYYLQPAFPQEPAAYGYFHNYPRCWEQLIAVSACRTDDAAKEYALFSNHGNIAAPGAYMTIDTGLNNTVVDPVSGKSLRYITWAGTSFATGLVSGLAARLLKNNSPEAIKRILWNSATRSNQWGQAPIIK